VNPFDLSGPGFLVFYWTLSIISLLFIYWLRLSSDVTGRPAQMTSDPCLLAYLRDGYPEVVRVALLTLVDEGAIAVKDRELSLAPEGTRPRFQRKRTAVEQQLLDYLARPATVDQIVDGGIGRDACLGYQVTLEDFGYLRRSADLASVRAACVGLAILLAAVAFIKFAVAWSRGHTNVVFLIFSGLTAVWLVLKVGSFHARITTRGEQALDGAEALLAGARERLKAASAALLGPELAWIAAAFGFSVFNFTPNDFAFWPALAFASGSRYKPPHERQTDSSFWSSSSCGSGGSSCGGGGASSCGGGGGCGGGGCGGCGGG
jgi:uncharacterized protein (TIGR04222 family)